MAGVDVPDLSRAPSLDQSPDLDPNPDPSPAPCPVPIPDPIPAPVAFGRRAVPLLFEQLQHPDSASRRRALTSLCDLVHDPEQLYRTVSGGFLEQLKSALTDEDPSIRTKTCELLHLLTSHSIGRRALLGSSLLPVLSRLLDDGWSSCRRSVQRVLALLALLPDGADAVLPLVPKLLLKLRAKEEEEQEEEEEVLLLLSTLGCCSRLDPLPALASDGVSVLARRLSHVSPNVRRAAAAAMMALSVPEDGKRQVCEEAVLPVLLGLLQDQDVELQTSAAGVIMFTVTTTAGKQRCLDLDVVPALLDLLKTEGEEEDEERRRRRRKALTLFSLRALTSLAEAPVGRRLLLEQLPVLVRRSGAAEQDQDIQRAAQTAVRVVTWTP